jgi:hypothetical protein
MVVMYAYVRTLRRKVSATFFNWENDPQIKSSQTATPN